MTPNCDCLKIKYSQIRILYRISVDFGCLSQFTANNLLFCLFLSKEWKIKKHWNKTDRAPFRFQFQFRWPDESRTSSNAMHCNLNYVLITNKDAIFMYFFFSLVRFFLHWNFKHTHSASNMHKNLYVLTI